jgi:hypothetical protein
MNSISSCKNNILIGLFMVFSDFILSFIINSLHTEISFYYTLVESFIFIFFILGVILYHCKIIIPNNLKHSKLMWWIIIVSFFILSFIQTIYLMLYYLYIVLAYEKLK